MARKSRIHFPGACYHVILRGNGGQDIFIDEQDRSRFFFLLQEGEERYRHRIHAYCLMTNHVHLVIQVGAIPLSRIMQNLSFRYTLHFNHRKKTTGHLFQGRYKALLIEADSYLLELVRYLHNKPVRAGMVKSPEQYEWSSHNTYRGTKNTSWLTTDWVLSQCHENERKASAILEAFILDGIHEGQRKDFYRGNYEGRILGDDHFVEKALAGTEQNSLNKPTLKRVLRVVSAHLKVDYKSLAGGGRQRPVAEARAVTAFLVREYEHLRLTDLSTLLQRDLSGLSQAAGRLQRKLQGDESLAACIATIRKRL
jgi:putative transposase